MFPQKVNVKAGFLLMGRITLSHFFFIEMLLELVDGYIKAKAVTLKISHSYIYEHNHTCCSSLLLMEGSLSKA